MSGIEHPEKPSLWQRIESNVRYCMSGVWSDTRNVWSVKVLKVINLSVRSFLDRDLQTQACALTYRTVLAIVPALALLFAIARGFGFQNLLKASSSSTSPLSSTRWKLRWIMSRTTLPKPRRVSLSVSA